MNEGLIIPEIPEPQDVGEPQKPTRDAPNGKGMKLDGGLVKSSQTPDDIGETLAQMPPKASDNPNNET